MLSAKEIIRKQVYADVWKKTWDDGTNEAWIKITETIEKPVHDRVVMWIRSPLWIELRVGIDDDYEHY